MLLFPSVSPFLSSMLYRYSTHILILIVLVLVLFCSIGLTIYDKIAARKRKRNRIPEKILFLFAIFGGALPMYITMLTISHKTRHLRFMIGLPCIIAIQTAAFIALTILL